MGSEMCIRDSYQCFDVFRTGPTPRYGNRDEIDIEIGKELGVELGQCPYAGDQHHGHEKVGSHWVVGQGGQEAPLHSDHLIIGGCGGHLKAVDGAG